MVVRLILILVTICLAFGCNKAADPLSKEERAWLDAHDGEIIVAAEPDWPPITFFADDGRYSGMIPDYIHLLEQRLGCRFQLKKAANWAEILEQAKAAQVHVIMDVMPTPERAQYLNFTPFYLEIATVIITRKEIPPSLSLADLAGQNVATVEDFQICDYLKKHYPAIQLVTAKTTVEAIRRLSGGEFDAIVAELPTASYLIEQENITNLHIAGFTGHKYQLAIGTHKDMPLLAGILQKGLALITARERQRIQNHWISLQQEETAPDLMSALKGTVIALFFLILTILFAVGIKKLRKEQKLTDKAYSWYIWTALLPIAGGLLLLILVQKDYFRQDPLTREERSWLVAHDGKIRFALADGYPPFDFYDENNKYIGLSADYIRLIEQKLHFRFKMVRLQSWEEIISKTQSGKIDVISSIQKNPSRSEFLLFTRSYIDVPSIIITRQEVTTPLSLDTMGGMKIAVVKNFAVEEYLKEQHSHLDLHPFPDPLSGLISVAFKSTDAMVLDLPVAAYYITKEGIVNLRMAGTTEYKENFRIASRKDWPILNRILDKGLAMITNNERAAIRQKWIQLEQLPLYRTKNFWISASIPSLVVITIILSIIIWNRSLQNQVRERTRALKEELEERRKTEQELKVAKEQAESANLAKTVFLANISHEIRTPLNAVTGFSELLTPLVFDQKQKSYLKAIKVAGNCLLLLINDILDLSRIESGMTKIQLAPVCLKTILNEIEQIFDVKISKKSLQFFIDIDPALPDSLLLDEIRLRQVLFNLVGNAIKFTDTGFIRILAEKHADSDNGTINLKISIEDSGIGIPEEQQKIIFDSFVQHDTNHTQKYGGTGLGLSICKGLVEMMNGQITVTSTINVGSTFSILLSGVKIGTLDEHPAQINDLGPQDISFSKAKVLAVDDIESNRELLTELLTRLKLDVMTAANGQEALLLAVEYQPDVILMDIRLPVLDGAEAARQLKLNARTQHVPVIAVTASTIYRDRSKLLQEGFDGYLTKPITMANLINELAVFLEHTRNERKTEKQKVYYPEIEIDHISDIPGLVRDIENQIRPLLETLQKGLIMEQVIQFGKTVSELGHKHRIEVLVRQGEELVMHARTFDIANISRLEKRITKQLDTITATTEREDD